jgi:hypothetical protein
MTTTVTADTLKLSDTQIQQLLQLQQLQQLQEQLNQSTSGMSAPVNATLSQSTSGNNAETSTIVIEHNNSDSGNVSSPQTLVVHEKLVTPDGVAVEMSSPQQSDTLVVENTMVQSTSSHVNPLSTSTVRASESKKSRDKKKKKKAPVDLLADDFDELSHIDYDEDDEEIVEIKRMIFVFVKDVVFNMIFTIPALRVRLETILNDPDYAIKEISRVFDGFKDRITRNELVSLKKYVCRENTRDSLTGILDVAFKNIMADGKIDITDAPHFITLIHNVVGLFNRDNSSNNADITITGEKMQLLIHFILKCIFVLTMDGPEEAMAISLLDGSFKLLAITVSPVFKKGCWCCFGSKKPVN